MIGPFGQMGRINCGVFWVFPVELSAHTLLLCVLNPWFSINKHFYKKLRHFKGIYIFGIRIYKFGLQRNRTLAIMRPKSVDLGIWWCVLCRSYAPWSVVWFAFSAKYFMPLCTLRKIGNPIYLDAFFFNIFNGKKWNSQLSQNLNEIGIFLFRY